MFGIGFTELIILTVVALVFVGPERLPNMMRQLGKLFVHTRRMASDVRSTVDEVVRDAEREIRVKEIEDMKQKMKKLGPELRKEAEDAFTLKEQDLSITTSPRNETIEEPLQSVKAKGNSPEVTDDEK